MLLPLQEDEISVYVNPEETVHVYKLAMETVFMKDESLPMSPSCINHVGICVKKKLDHVSQHTFSESRCN